MPVTLKLCCIYLVAAAVGFIAGPILVAAGDDASRSFTPWLIGTLAVLAGAALLAFLIATRPPNRGGVLAAWFWAPLSAALPFSVAIYRPAVEGDAMGGVLWILLTAAAVLVKFLPVGVVRLVRLGQER